ncbi:MAG: hypothetical protein WDA09_08925 [Bacteriovoracaceae bacterium]
MSSFTQRVGASPLKSNIVKKKNRSNNAKKTAVPERSYIQIGKSSSFHYVGDYYHGTDLFSLEKLLNKHIPEWADSQLESLCIRGKKRKKE